MTGKLLLELRQSVPFESLEEEAGLNLLRSADLLKREVGEVLRPAEIAHTHYNILRILRGALKDKDPTRQALTCGEIADRLITFEPDITRLSDKLERQRFITRERSVTDRRIVRSRITTQGLSILSQLQPAIKACHAKRLGHLNRKALSELIAHLEKLRA